jgi:tRNA-splicing ligase RtcB (3'-phosphate/5'-hydroxy nucleic acid ligase)
MIKVITTESKPIKSWVTDLEDGALEQAKNLANLPFVHKHVALMADCHLGYGMPIGGVIATKNVIIPNAVGVDISCGVAAVKTNFKDEIKKDTVKKIMEVIRKVVPVGVGKNHKDPCPEESMPTLQHSTFVDTLIPSARYQMGTLGSGKLIASNPV